MYLPGLPICNIHIINVVACVTTVTCFGLVKQHYKILGPPADFGGDNYEYCVTYYCY